MGMNQHEKPAPPERRWDEALDPHAHQGPYRPPAALLDILARAAGANSYEAATTAVRHRAASAATELHEAGLDPRVVFMGAMVSYFFKVMLLGVFLVLFRNADWLSPIAFAITAIVVSLAGTIGEIVAFTRVKTYIYDEPGASAGAAS